MGRSCGLTERKSDHLHGGRLPGAGGELVSFKQSWLCSLDMEAVVDEDTVGRDGKFKSPPR